MDGQSTPVDIDITLWLSEILPKNGPVQYSLIPMKYVNRHFFDAIHLPRVSKARWSKHCAEEGYLDLLQWGIHNFDCPTREICSNAARGGHWELVRWARQGPRVLFWDSTVYISAIQSRHPKTLDNLDWLLQEGCPLHSEVCDAAAKEGLLDIIIWFERHRGGHPMSRQFTSVAADQGYLHILEWAYDRELHISKKVCDRAAMKGHLHVLKWAVSKGHQWTERTAKIAAYAGHLNIIKWSVEMNYDSPTTILLSAIKGGRVDVLEWARQNQWPSRDLWVRGVMANELNWRERAVIEGHVNVLQWAFNLNLLSPSVPLLKIAEKCGQEKAAQWLRPHIQLQVEARRSGLY
eukprot:TRINITY_DN12294_c0_g1_i2.p1 TRINITY_DN12294_c0_g1~~TRINITY_DN12294_c0_g1_i2.p1  ORF type:complete len:349 (+),score=38.38 TRINITY_DN12294_c0_g1_i2:597-1643(+)